MQNGIFSDAAAVCVTGQDLTGFDRFPKCWLIKHHAVCVLLFCEVSSREVLNVQDNSAFVKQKGENWMTFSPLTAACWLNRLSTLSKHTYTQHTHQRYWNITHTWAHKRGSHHVVLRVAHHSVIVFWLVFITVCSKPSGDDINPLAFHTHANSCKTCPPKKPFEE